MILIVGALRNSPTVRYPTLILQSRNRLPKDERSSCPGAPSIYIIPTLWPKVYKYDLLWAIWSPQDGLSAHCWRNQVSLCGFLSPMSPKQQKMESLHPRSKPWALSIGPNKGPHLKPHPNEEETNKGPILRIYDYSFCIRNPTYGLGYILHSFSTWTPIGVWSKKEVAHLASALKSCTYMALVTEPHMNPILQMWVTRQVTRAVQVPVPKDGKYMCIYIYIESLHPDNYKRRPPR